MEGMGWKTDWNLLVSVLTGFEALYGQFGYFTPQPKLVRFNRIGEVRVWVHQDFTISENR